MERFKMIKLRHLFYTTLLLSQSFMSFGTVPLELSQAEMQSVQQVFANGFSPSDTRVLLTSNTNIKLTHNKQSHTHLSSPLGDLPSEIVLFQQDAQEGMTRMEDEKLIMAFGITSLPKEVTAQVVDYCDVSDMHQLLPALSNLIQKSSVVRREFMRKMCINFFGHTVTPNPQFNLPDSRKLRLLSSSLLGAYNIPIGILRIDDKYLINFFSNPEYSAQKRDLLTHLLVHKKDDHNTLEFFKISLNSLQHGKFSRWAKQILFNDQWLKYFNLHKNELKECFSPDLIGSLKQEIEWMLTTGDNFSRFLGNTEEIVHLVTFVNLYELGFHDLEKKIRKRNFANVEGAEFNFREGFALYVAYQRNPLDPKEEDISFEIFQYAENRKLNKGGNIEEFFFLSETHYPTKWLDFYIYLIKKNKLSDSHKTLIANRILEKDPSQKGSVIGAYLSVISENMKYSGMTKDAEQAILQIDPVDGKKALMNTYLFYAYKRNWGITLMAIERLIQLDFVDLKLKPILLKLLISIADDNSNVYSSSAIKSLIKLDPSYTPTEIEKLRSIVHNIEKSIFFKRPEAILLAELDPSSIEETINIFSDLSKFPDNYERSLAERLLEELRRMRVVREGNSQK